MLPVILLAFALGVAAGAAIAAAAVCLTEWRRESRAFPKLPSSFNETGFSYRPKPVLFNARADSFHDPWRLDA